MRIGFFSSTQGNYQGLFEERSFGFQVFTASGTTTHFEKTENGLIKSRDLLFQYEFDEVHLWDFPRIIEKKSEAIILAHAWTKLRTLYCANSKEKFHLVFAHAFPVPDIESKFCMSLFLHMEDVVSLGQILILPCSEFWLVNPSNLNQLVSASTQLQKIATKNRGVTVRKTLELHGILASWERFCLERFNSVVDPSLLKLLLDLYESDSDRSFFVKEFYFKSVKIAESLLLEDRKEGILYDMLVPWNQTHKGLSPGLFSGLSNIHDAFSLGLKYSLCYGNYPYKELLVGNLQRCEY